MNILAFDTCFDACSACVASARDGAPAASVIELAGAREVFETGHAERLVPMIAEVMQRAGVAFDAIDRIAVTVGPGTFTGTRIGVAAARGLSLATGISLVGASSLEVMAAVAAEIFGGAERPAAEFAAADLLITVDARRGEVYAQLFDAAGAIAKTAPQVLSIGEAACVGSGPLLIAGSGADAVAAVASGAGRRAMPCLPQLLPHAGALAQIAARRPSATAPLQPLYLRAPDAKPQHGKSIARAQA